MGNYMYLMLTVIRINWSALFIAILSLAVGLLNLFRPRRMWHLKHGWKLKNAEPSEDVIGLYMLSGWAFYSLQLSHSWQVFNNPLDNHNAHKYFYPAPVTPYPKYIF